MRGSIINFFLGGGGGVIVIHVVYSDTCSCGVCLAGVGDQR